MFKIFLQSQKLIFFYKIIIFITTLEVKGWSLSKN